MIEVKLRLENEQYIMLHTLCTRIKNATERAAKTKSNEKISEMYNRKYERVLQNWDEIIKQLEGVR